MVRIALTAAACLAVAAGNALAVGHLADVTLMDRTTGRTLPVYWRDGQAWVAGAPGHEYSVTVRNREGRDVLAPAYGRREPQPFPHRFTSDPR